MNRRSIGGSAIVGRFGREEVPLLNAFIPRLDVACDNLALVPTQHIDHLIGPGAKLPDAVGIRAGKETSPIDFFDQAFRIAYELP